MKHGIFQVRINDTNGPHFVGGKGLKQGDPHSPLLFNLVADVFSKMLVKAVNNGLIGGLLPHAIPGGVASLQYADDTILVANADSTQLEHIKNLLLHFAAYTGLKVNYSKSTMISINTPEDKMHFLSDLLGCQIGTPSLQYLGLPLASTNLGWKTTYLF